MSGPGLLPLHPGLLDPALPANVPFVHLTLVFRVQDLEDLIPGPCFWRLEAKQQLAVRFDESDTGVSKLGVTYIHYRCQPLFERLAKWLRAKGIKANKPLHTLRKEFGSIINAKADIHAASRALRHGSTQVTDLYYADSRRGVTVGLGHLLKQPTNITPIAAADHLRPPESEAQ